MVAGITIRELLARADAAEDFLLLDVRNQDEFAAWRVEARRPVETLHLPYFDFIEDADGSIARIPEGREVVVLCAKGGSSEMVAEMLADAGRRARNVEGGMVAYGNHLEARSLPLPPGSRHEIHQVLRRGKGCLSYVVRAGGEAVVVDPCRHVEFYEELVRGLDARIVLVLETHVHADHVSGGRKIAARAGVPCTVDAGEDRRIPLGGISIEVLPAPGHTPDSRIYVVAGSHVLSGDTLFVAGVGRPDLGGEVVPWAKELFRTLRERVARLPYDTVVLPAHFASAAEVGADGIVSGRLGDLRRTVPELTIIDESEFVRAMESSARPAPPAYARIVRVNRGLEEATEDQAAEWELGKNQCALTRGG